MSAVNSSHARSGVASRRKRRARARAVPVHACVSLPEHPSTACCRRRPARWRKAMTLSAGDSDHDHRQPRHTGIRRHRGAGCRWGAQTSRDQHRRPNSPAMLPMPQVLTCAQARAASARRAGVRSLRAGANGSSTTRRPACIAQTGPQDEAVATQTSDRLIDTSWANASAPGSTVVPSSNDTRPECRRRRHAHAPVSNAGVRAAPRPAA